MAATAAEPLDLVVLELDVEEWDACRLVAALRKRHPGLSVVGITAGADTRLPASAMTEQLLQSKPSSALT